MKVSVLELKCSQLALGMLEAKKKAKEYKAMSKKEFKKENKKNPVSVVIGPRKEMYIVDGHHHAVATWLADYSKVHIEVIKDFSRGHISYPEFWKYMKKHHCLHLYDQFGDGPHDPLYLPDDVRGMGDDPYRSLAWLVRKEGAIKKVEKRFADFDWANFFRKEELLHRKEQCDFDAAKRKAMRLARSSRAKHLPGFCGKHQ